MNQIELRSAQKGDEKALAHIQTEAWKAAFSEILSPETLKKYTNAAKAEEMYQSVLENKFGKGTILSVGGTPCCMAFWSGCREPEHAGSAELICIHSLRHAWGRGYGALVMNRVLGEMRAEQYREAVLWVFEKNLRARRFYEKQGFTPTDQRKDSYGAVETLYRKIL